MPGPYRRIDHPNPNSFVVSAESAAAAKKPKPVKKAAAPAVPKPAPVDSADDPAEKAESKSESVAKSDVKD